MNNSHIMPGPATPEFDPTMPDFDHMTIEQHEAAARAFEEALMANRVQIVITRLILDALEAGGFNSLNELVAAQQWDPSTGDLIDQTNHVKKEHVDE